jgi:hypothetical protein
VLVGAARESALNETGPATRIAAGYDVGIAQQWESLGAEEESPSTPLEPAVAAPKAVVAMPAPVVATPATVAPVPSRPAWTAAKSPVTNGHAANSHPRNGQPANDRAPSRVGVPSAPPVSLVTSAHAPAAHGKAGNYTFAQAAREAGSVEHAAVDLGARPAARPAAPAPKATPAAAPEQPAARPAPAPVTAAAHRAQAPAPDKNPEPRGVNHPALQSLRFPKTGVSRQWQDFLDQLAASQ